MAKFKPVDTELPFFSTGAPHNKRHHPKMRKAYGRIFNSAADFFTKQRLSLPRGAGASDEVAFQAFVSAFIEDYGVANLLAAIAATFHDRAERYPHFAFDAVVDSDRARAERHELIMWANRIGAIAHEIHADDAKRDIVE